MFYKLFIKSLLFILSPEQAHIFVAKTLEMAIKIPFVVEIIRKKSIVKNERLEQTICGITFKNPVGVAAGFDKNALLFDELYHLGFGYVEIGTVTPKPQSGNPKPRLFRLPKDEGLINRMGFNNDGVDAVVERLKKKKTDVIIGGNIGKNKVTPNENAADDYLICFQKLFPYVDYFVVNVSSPNTPGLRDLQAKAPLTELLKALQNENNKNENPKPVFLKIAPDLSDAAIDDIIEIVIETKLSGLIATNTTVSRKNLKTKQKKIEAMGNGGLSGKPLRDISTKKIEYIAQKAEGRFKIIGVGGIHNADDAIEKMSAGADLIQIFTGFIYSGPSLVKKINKEILKYGRSQNH